MAPAPLYQRKPLHLFLDQTECAVSVVYSFQIIFTQASQKYYGGA